MNVRMYVSFLLLFGLLQTAPARADVVDLKTRDTTIRLLIEAPASATHVIGLLPGGKGLAAISDDGSIGAGAGNFAIRSRGHLLEHGFATAVIAPPADIPDLIGNRDRDAYAEDIGNVVGYLRERFGLPVWLHGTSRGTISISMTVHKITDPARRPDGLVLSAGVTQKSKDGKPTALDGDLSGFTGPALVLHHRNDPCGVTKPKKAALLLDALSSSARKDLVWIEGGDGQASGRPCGARTQHGFIGVEDKASDAIAAFVKAGG